MKLNLSSYKLNLDKYKTCEPDRKLMLTLTCKSYGAI